VGIHTDRAAVYNAARCNCIPTQRVGTREKMNTLPFYKLCSITYLEKGIFALVLTDGENIVNGRCEVQEIKSEALGKNINLAQFHPEEFRKLCTMGQVDSKAIGDLVLSFYKNFYSSELVCSL
jgi:hypothetical protein